MAPTPPPKAITVRRSGPHFEGHTQMTPSGERVLIAKPAVLDLSQRGVFKLVSVDHLVRQGAPENIKSSNVFSNPLDLTGTNLPDDLEVIASPNGLFLNPAEGSEIKFLIEDGFVTFSDMMAQHKLQGRPIIVNVQHWANAPEAREQLSRDLQSLATDFDVPIELRWREDGQSLKEQFKPGPDPVEEELLQSLSENPKDEVAMQVYADYLMQKGGLRGELLSLQADREQPESAQRIREIEKALIRGLEEELGVEIDHYTFENGFLKSLTVKGATSETIGGLTQNSLTALVRRINVIDPQVEHLSTRDFWSGDEALIRYSETNTSGMGGVASNAYHQFKGERWQILTALEKTPPDSPSAAKLRWAFESVEYNLHGLACTLSYTHDYRLPIMEVLEVADRGNRGELMPREEFEKVLEEVRRERKGD